MGEAQLEGQLSNTWEALAGIHSTNKTMPIVPELGRWRQEGQKFKVILTYIANSSSAWTM